MVCQLGLMVCSMVRANGKTGRSHWGLVLESIDE